VAGSTCDSEIGSVVYIGHRVESARSWSRPSTVEAEQGTLVRYV
jgi:hypothetical protein